tara:strand:- start:762 stop:1196 length:435 start_codon:yes stop_codon:yes gene_type:complete
MIPLISVLFCYHERAYAETERGPEDTTVCVEAWSVVFKDKAPCTGLLVPFVEAHRALKCLSEKLPKCEVDKKAAVDKAAAREKALKAEVAAEKKRAGELKKLLGEALQVAPPEHPWWKHPVLWTAIGIAVGAASTYAIVKLTEK